MLLAAPTSRAETSERKRLFIRHSIRSCIHQDGVSVNSSRDVSRLTSCGFFRVPLAEQRAGNSRRRRKCARQSIRSIVANARLGHANVSFDLAGRKQGRSCKDLLRQLFRRRGVLHREGRRLDLRGGLIQALGTKSAILHAKLRFCAISWRRWRSHRDRSIETDAAHAGTGLHVSETAEQCAKHGVRPVEDRRLAQWSADRNLLAAGERLA